MNMNNDRLAYKIFEYDLQNISNDNWSGDRSCTDNIFCLRNIIEQSLEWRSSLYINFIDFEKAFDSIHRITLWKIMEAYGIPRKIIGIIRDMYDGFRCTVKHEGSTSDWILITSCSVSV